MNDKIRILYNTDLVNTIKAMQIFFLDLNDMARKTENSINCLAYYKE